jgi:hypothetical protein
LVAKVGSADVAEWLVEHFSEDAPTLVGIDHGFSFRLRYFEAYAFLWPGLLLRLLVRTTARFCRRHRLENTGAKDDPHYRLHVSELVARTA